MKQKISNRLLTRSVKQGLLKKKQADKKEQVDDKKYILDDQVMNEFQLVVNVKESDEVKSLLETCGVILPEENDPNFYCRACDRYYKGKIGYRAHLRSMHKMKLCQPIPNNLYIRPDKYHLYNYCFICEKNFSSRYEYRRHLQCVHKFQLTPQLVKG